MDDSQDRRQMNEYLRKLHELPCYRQLLAQQDDMREYVRTLRSNPGDPQDQASAHETDRQRVTQPDKRPPRTRPGSSSYLFGNMCTTLIDLNQATKTELMRINQIGTVLADRILEASHFIECEQVHALP